MRIVMITPYWSTKGGISTTVRSLVAELRKEPSTEVYIVSRDSALEVFTVTGNLISINVRILFILRKLRPEVVHVHAHGSLLLGPILYKLISRRVRVIFTFHTQPDAHLGFGTRTAVLHKKEESFPRKLVLRFLLRNCDAVTCVSRSLGEKLIAQEKSLIQRYYPILTAVHENSVSQAATRQFMENWGLEDAYPVIAMVGVLSWEWKVAGVRILIEAFDQVLRDYPSARLLIVGDGQYRPQLEECIDSRGLSGKAVITGFLDNPAIALQVVDIYAHISLNEALGLSILEAMIAGKPVVASNNGGIPEIITDGLDGILVESTPDSVAKVLLTLAKDYELMERLSQNARNTALMKFSWQKAAEEYLKTYRGDVV